MTQQDQRGTEIWREADFARDWASNDGLADILEFPRRIAAAVVADDNTAPECVVDIGSGPGAFLAVFLDQFPSALKCCATVFWGTYSVSPALISCRLGSLAILA